MAIIKKIRKRSNNSFFLMLLFFLLSVLIIYFSHISDGKLIAGDDFAFHKMRIEGLYESIMNGVYFPRLNMTFMNSMGYASSIFYSDIFLYFPAILRTLGFSLAESYVSLLILINFITFSVAYFSMYIVEEKVNKSLLFSILYTLSTYRLFDLTKRAALGEVLAFAFLPLAFMGLYQILYKNQKKWYYLTLGMSLIIFAHLLSAVLFALLILVFLVLNWKELYHNSARRNSFIKAVIFTIPLVMFYLLPILEQLRSQDLRVSTNPIVYISVAAMNLQDIVTQSLSNVSHLVNIGIVLLIFIMLYIIKIRHIKSNMTKHIFTSVILFIFLSTNLFPWKFFDKTFLNTIQFPWRFFTLVTLCLCWVIAQDEINMFKHKKSANYLMILVTLFSLSYSLNANQYMDNKIMSYGQFNEPSTYDIGFGKEYLPKEANLDELMKYNLDLIYNSNELTTTNYSKNRDEITFNFESSTKQVVTLPLVYYKGYVAELVGTGELSEPYLSKEGLLSIDVIGEGNVKVFYKGTILQFITLYFSIGSWIIFTLWLILTREKKLSKEKVNFFNIPVLLKKEI